MESPKREKIGGWESSWGNCIAKVACEPEDVSYHCVRNPIAES